MQSLNFSTQCLENWRSLPGGAPALWRLVDALSRELEAAPKFVLPEGGRPLDDPDSIARMLPDLQLPFPCVALEYLSAGPVGEDEVASGKRISLVWALDQCSPQPLQVATGVRAVPRRSLLVQSISYVDEAAFWMPVLGMVEIHLDGEIEKHRPETIDPLLLELTKHRMRQPPGSAAIASYPGEVHVTVDHIIDQVGKQAAHSLITADSGDEVLAALSFAALTGCGNVSFEVLPAPAALNRKRLASGKTPLFDTRVLVVGESGYVQRSQPSAAGTGGGTHASPRTHLRRGHIRRLPSGNKFIPRTVVNPGNNPAPVPRYSVQRGG